MPILTILFTWRNGVSPRSQGGQLWAAKGRFYNQTGWDHGGSTGKKKKRSVMDCKRVGNRDARGPIPKMQGDDSTNEPGGIMEVAMLGFHLTLV